MVALQNEFDVSYLLLSYLRHVEELLDLRRRFSPLEPVCGWAGWRDIHVGLATWKSSHSSFSTSSCSCWGPSISSHCSFWSTQVVILYRDHMRVPLQVDSAVACLLNIPVKPSSSYLKGQRKCIPPRNMRNYSLVAIEVAQLFTDSNISGNHLQVSIEGW
jgi:hypothetical protein